MCFMIEHSILSMSTLIFGPFHIFLVLNCLSFLFIVAVHSSSDIWIEIVSFDCGLSLLFLVVAFAVQKFFSIYQRYHSFSVYLSDIFVKEKKVPDVVVGAISPAFGSQIQEIEFKASLGNIDILCLQQENWSHTQIEKEKEQLPSQFKAMKVNAVNCECTDAFLNFLVESLK